jgi:seryl-tRNA synthetase
MSILRFEQFNPINEDTVSNLTQQKNSLSQQINDLQKKLLDVQAQLVAAQKQTLNQNPQAQIPMQESSEAGGWEKLPAGIQIKHASYRSIGGGQGILEVQYVHEGTDEHVEADVDDFEDYLEYEAINDFDKEDLKRFHRTEGATHYFATEDFWDALSDDTKKQIIVEYLKKKNLLD